MSAAALLDRLQRVRPAGEGRWTAACPVCQSRRGRPLSIRETGDGRVLVHPFCGCTTGAVLGAVGLELRDLFPKPLGDSLAPVRDRGHWHAQRAALEEMRDEARVLLLVAAAIADGRRIGDEDAQRVAVAASRMASSVEALYGSR